MATHGERGLRARRMKRAEAASINSRLGRDPEPPVTSNPSNSLLVLSIVGAIVFLIAATFGLTATFVYLFHKLQNTHNGRVSSSTHDRRLPPTARPGETAETPTFLPIESSTAASEETSVPIEVFVDDYSCYNNELFRLSQGIAGNSCVFVFSSYPGAPRMKFIPSDRKLLLDSDLEKKSFEKLCPDGDHLFRYLSRVN